jgi:hypothetical protein
LFVLAAEQRWTSASAEGHDRPSRNQARIAFMAIGHYRVGIRSVVRIVASASIAALTLAACTKQSPPSEEIAAAPAASDSRSSELNWAREALQRNPTIEVVATDSTAGVFTVRFKDSGEVRAIRLTELAATPISSLAAPTGTTAAPAEAQEPTSAAPAATPQSASRSEEPAATPTAATTDAQSSQPNPNYTIERTDGQVKVSGPGVSIVSTGNTTVSAAEGAAGQRSAEPIICEGRRMLHFDNRNIFVDGDALIARGGCELYITNSRVVASGTAVVVRDATVHISNSTIEGGAASFDADENAKVYVRSSTFQGLPRRSERAVVQDQGGNQWR